MTVDAAFMGGPAHGALRAFPGDEPPPGVTHISVDPETGAQKTVEYRREVSTLDTGPLWVFVPIESPST